MFNFQFNFHIPTPSWNQVPREPYGLHPLQREPVKGMGYPSNYGKGGPPMHVGKGPASGGFEPGLKGSIGEGSNHSNYSDQSSVTIPSKFNPFF